ncbi:hypothetical protein ADUPG1_007930 [Aduncisulcus paluster]|uniref:Uncharacterized protein n=1 Tax=Aduncisulcus paluster TaxID=2918883 RepID=A0ABQ5KSM6_9EUKA|nr:hypothetical protein ADUPG1_007930 [Aduncisulcus paluster]|eukprot:gnl/Carplike_NY0171/4764_a6490_354.p1 GENE.gnl/Carplike_NY0171/4764_a6490_354~~gnl/Carplike_NY0171/4764_a6490_354.p1  ORF type:complete len:431 (+),score=118.78 gnl/Carplike_NY0171/4764_a6490_354:29-1321(+)
MSEQIIRGTSIILAADSDQLTEDEKDQFKRSFSHYSHPGFSGKAAMDSTDPQILRQSSINLAADTSHQPMGCSIYKSTFAEKEKELLEKSAKTPCAGTIGLLPGQIRQSSIVLADRVPVLGRESTCYGMTQGKGMKDEDISKTRRVPCAGGIPGGDEFDPTEIRRSHITMGGDKGHWDTLYADQFGRGGEYEEVIKEIDGVPTRIPRQKVKIAPTSDIDMDKIRATSFKPHAHVESPNDLKVGDRTMSTTYGQSFFSRQLDTKLVPGKGESESASNLRSSSIVLGHMKVDPKSVTGECYGVDREQIIAEHVRHVLPPSAREKDRTRMSSFAVNSGDPMTWKSETHLSFQGKPADSNPMAKEAADDLRRSHITMGTDKVACRTSYTDTFKKFDLDVNPIAKEAQDDIRRSHIMLGTREFHSATTYQDDFPK